MNLYISNLCVEVTRQCPMSCTHCLRGDAENKHLNITRFEEWVASITENDGCLTIGELTLSGGEPLYGQGLENVIGVLSIFKKHDVEVQDFYIATSGFNLSRKAFLACAEWYAYCADNEVSQVHLSNDAYHPHDIDRNGVRLFKGLSFFSDKFSEDGVEYLLVPQGRAIENYQPRQMKPYEQKPDTYECDHWGDEAGGESVGIADGTIYYNVNNMLIRGCDWSYDVQDNDKSVQLCKADEFIKKLKRKKEGESRL